MSHQRVSFEPRYDFELTDTPTSQQRWREWGDESPTGPPSLASGYSNLELPITKKSASQTSLPTEWKPSTRVKLIVLTMCTVTLLIALDATSLSVALPVMAEELNADAITAFWAGTSYLLCATVFQPTLSSLSGIFGRKPVIIFALTLFTAGAIIAALANNFTVILVGRCIQGVGGGGLIALAEIVITDCVPMRQRGKYFAFLSGTNSLGSVAGPVVGGGFSGEVSWRWIFWINIPFCVVLAVMIPLFVKLKLRREGMLAKLMKVDWFGSFIFVSSTTSLLIPLSWGGVMYSWSSWRTLLPLLAGLAGLTIFVLWEIYGAENPTINMRLFMDRNAAAGYFSAATAGLILWSLLYYLPIYFELVKGYTPMQAGLACFPETFTVMPAAVVTGVLITKTGRYRWALWGGWSLTATGMGIMYMIDVGTPMRHWIPMNVVAGVGLGMVFPGTNYCIQSGASDKDMATAVGLYSFMRWVGQGLGIAAGGVIFQNALKNELKKFPELASGAHGYTTDAVGIVGFIKRMPSGPLKTQFVQAYTNALQIVWISMLGFALAGLFATIWVRELTLDRELKTEQAVVEEDGDERR
ncbi:major facilitator superfamily-domain-containing protein [Tricharina praecox]|uniref:major facilitator superfamily-domain-containing protein n=1 Tax=Tricharina praecox TaxID=43433 RepID=UPI00222055C8|nr:major facilitator superfamily-domain-containing protein [Tricharina praecox]KAI5846843.1 major facilitator superfamily-domain-containing protein [Tricharina praecox]